MEYSICAPLRYYPEYLDSAVVRTFVQFIDLDNSAVRKTLSTLYEYLGGRSKRPADK